MTTIKLMIISAFTLLSISTSFGQNVVTPKLPINSNGKITYSEVVYADSSVNKQEFLTKAREWFAKTNWTDVVIVEDQKSCKIIGKALMQVYHKTVGVNYPSGYINYTISICLKDGKYKYEIVDFYHTGQVLGDGQRIQDLGNCEKMINPNNVRASQKTYNYYLFQMDNSIHALITDLKATMKTKAANSRKEDW